MMVARSLKWVANHTRACLIYEQCTKVNKARLLALLETRASAIASAIARPSRVLVPLPSSSIMALQFDQYNEDVNEEQSR
jgi:hypothetical protein